MKPLNQTERTRRWGQFIGIYATLIVLIALCWWLSLALIPRLTNVQQDRSMQEMVAFRRMLAEPDQMLATVEQGAPLTDDWLRNFYAATSALDQKFSKPLFMATTNSYRQLAGEYENARRAGDAGLQMMNSQKVQLETRKAQLVAALASAGTELKTVAAAPKAKPAEVKPAEAAVPVIKAGFFGPFKPLLISGSGEFGANNPEVSVSVQFMIVRERQVVLGVYFETGGDDAATLAKIAERKEVFTAPPGYKVVGLSVPERTPWRINYVDKTMQPDKFDVGDGLLTFVVQGNTAGLDIGATGGSTLSIQLKKAITVTLEKE
jgi:hypothetical protein